jgi:hypothetical protein
LLFGQSALVEQPFPSPPDALPVFANPKQARAMPVRPAPNFFSAARRVTDWAMLFASSSNLLFILFLSFAPLFVAFQLASIAIRIWGSGFMA